MTSKQLFILSISVLVVSAATVWGYLWWQQRQVNQAVLAVDTYAECVAAGYPVTESYPEQCRTPAGETFTRPLRPDEGITSREARNVITGQEITLTGEIICLPHQVTEGPTTLECAYGLKDSKSGVNYALLSLDYLSLSNMATGQTVTVRGILDEKPSDSPYQIVGVMQVTGLEVSPTPAAVTE